MLWGLKNGGVCTWGAPFTASLSSFFWKLQHPYIVVSLPLTLHYHPESGFSNARLMTAALVCNTDGRSHKMQGLGQTFYPCRGTEQTGPFTQLPASESQWQGSLGKMIEKL